MHFLPFNPVDKRTAITYIDPEGKWYRASKGAPEQVPTCLNANLMVNISATERKPKEFRLKEGMET